jgi:hypothetical protein
VVSAGFGRADGIVWGRLDFDGLRTSEVQEKAVSPGHEPKYGKCWG